MTDARMVIHIEPFLLAVGLMIAGAFIGSLVFKRIRLPDIVFLLTLGVVLGPLTHFVDVEMFRAIVPLVSTIAIILILFDGGLKVSIDEILHGVASGSLLAVLVFVGTTVLCAGVAHLIAGVPPSLALMLGMALGGAGVVIVIPLIQEMGVSERTRTIVSIEAATADVLVVVGVVGFSTALALKQTDPSALARDLVQTFAVGIAAGIAAGFAWATVLRQFEERSYEYVLTMAALFLMYALVEILHGSGALAVLAFGLIVGNSRKTQKARRDPDTGRKRRGWVYAPVFGVDLQNLHNELVFFIRAFFFVALGVVLNVSVLASARFLLAGFLLSLAIVAGRYWGVALTFRKGKPDLWDKLAIVLMFPRGLAAAALSIVPYDRFAIPGTEDFGSFAAVVIVMTNLLSAILVYVVSREPTRVRLGGPSDAAIEEMRAKASAA